MEQKKTITINNSNKQYQMSTRIFMKDLEKICDIVNGENTDYKTSLISFIKFV